MTIPPFDHLSGGAHGPMWPAFYRQGLWTPTSGVNGFETAVDIENGDIQIEVNQLPNGAPLSVFTNMWEPIWTPSPGTPGSGYGKLLRLDPAGADIQILCRAREPFKTDPVSGNVVIQLARPVEGLSATLVAPVDIGMGHSPMLSVSSMVRKVSLVGISHALDDRGIVRSDAPDIALKMWMGDNPKGPFVEIGPLPAGVSFPAATAGDEISMGVFEIPPMAYCFFTAEDGGSDNGNSLFSFFVSRGGQQ